MSKRKSWKDNLSKIYRAPVGVGELPGVLWTYIAPDSAAATVAALNAQGDGFHYWVAN